MSKKDGKATLVRAVAKKMFVLQVTDSIALQTAELAKVCPVKIIRIL
jgi:hypothetical protein